jgi:hypothetical protein
LFAHIISRVVARVFLLPYKTPPFAKPGVCRFDHLDVATCVFSLVFRRHRDELVRMAPREVPEAVQPFFDPLLHHAIAPFRSSVTVTTPHGHRSRARPRRSTASSSPPPAQSTAPRSSIPTTAPQPGRRASPRQRRAVVLDTTEPTASVGAVRAAAPADRRGTTGLLRVLLATLGDRACSASFSHS